MTACSPKAAGSRKFLTALATSAPGRTATLPQAAAAGLGSLNFGLLRNLQSVIHLDSEVSDRTLEFRMAEEELNCA